MISNELSRAASMMQALDHDAEPTEADMRRVGLIAEELRRFGEAFTASLPVGGRA